MDCPGSFLHALDYSQVAGLFAGMICLGLIVDQIGRKWGSVSTAGIMFVGQKLLHLCCPATTWNACTPPGGARLQTFGPGIAAMQTST